MNAFRFFRRFCCLTLALCFAWLCLPAPTMAQEEEAAVPYPEALCITVQTEYWKTADGTLSEVDVPITTSAAVNATLRLAQRQLWKDALSHAGENDRVDVRATYRISGDSWAGFLLMARVVRLGRSEHNSYDTEETTYLDYRVFTFDMSTGQPLTLADVFPEGSPAWYLVSRLVSAQLNAYYSSTRRMESEPLEMSGFSFLPCAGRLLISLPLWETLPGKWQIVQVSLPYPDFRSLMTEEAQAQTDNSHRPIIALTFDDGPMLTRTRLVVRSLAQYGASATFFCIGESIAMWPDLVRTEMDYGHTVGSHTMEHKYAYQVDSQYLRDDREACLELHKTLLGLAPSLFRAPGGSYQKYVQYEIGWPLIQWTNSSGDTGNSTSDQLARRVVRNASNGAIVLMHDLHLSMANATAQMLEGLVEKGYLFATVEELMYLHGVTPKANTVYVNAFGEYEP